MIEIILALIFGIIFGAVPTYIAWRWHVEALKTAFDYEQEQRDWDPQY